MDIEENLKTALNSALKELGIETQVIHLEHPADITHGDFSTNIAMMSAQKEGKNPKELAENITHSIEKNKPEEIEKIEVAGPGFINFHLSAKFFTNSINEILKKENEWGRNDSQKGKKIMVEYTDPNPFKAFHIGHLMSNAIGESISRFVEYSGAEVKRANYYGDVGLHVAKTIWGKQQKPELSWGEAYAYGASNYEKNKDAIDTLNKKVYSKDDNEINELYNNGKKESIENFEILYKKLGTTFDLDFPESSVWEKGEAVVLQNKDVFEKSEGAIVFKGEKFDNTLHTRVFISSQGLPTYEAKELGLAYAKQEKYPFDISITITANEIDTYFRVVLKALEQFDKELASKIKHVSHGFMKLPNGKMSSRTGDVIAAEDLINDVKEAVLAIESERDIPDKEKTAEIIAVGALKYSILKQATGKDIIFEKEKALSFEGDSGPYLQYAHTRAQSVLERAGSSGDISGDISGEKIILLERLLYRFPEVVERAQKEYEPHYVTTYLTELAGAFNSFYAKEKIIGGDNEGYNLALTKAFVITMKNGLYLLGIQAPDKM